MNEQEANEQYILLTLGSYDDLVDIASSIARIVYGLRFPRDPAPGFQITFDTEQSTPRVYASYYHGGGTHVLEFPLSYLWAGDAVAERERQRIEAERLAAEKQRELREASEEAERDAADRKQYERLKKRFEKDGPP